MRLNRAEKVRLESEEKLLELTSEFQVSFEEETIKNWLSSEQSCVNRQEPNSEGGKLLEKLGVIARERWFMLSIS